MEKLEIKNRVFKKQALQSLRDRWGDSVLTTLVYFGLIVTISIIPFWWVTLALHFLIALPLGYGIMVYFLILSRDERAQLIFIFDGFNRYKETFLTILYMALMTLVWGLLLIIPGIVKFYAYSMTWYILKDTHLTRMSALERSETLMEGNVMKLFLVDLSFIGWGILTLQTYG